MSAQTFNIGGVAAGTWVLQSAGGATLSTVSIGNDSSSAVTLVSLYDNPVSGTNLINQFAVPKSDSRGLAIGAVLQHGLTVTISAQSSHATIVLENTEEGPIAEFTDR